jgi:hypothetical protein
MDWVIFNNRGSRIRAFEDEDSAGEALLELAERTDEPLHLLCHDDAGRVVERRSIADVMEALGEDGDDRDDHAWVRVVAAPDVVRVSGGNREPTPA